MTEHEKREKAMIEKVLSYEQIEKVMIEKVLSDEQIKIANDVDEFAKLQKVGISKCYADALYDANYRKADEVRKETAKEIYKDVLYLRELMVNSDDALCILRNVESWAKETGVEVKE